MKGLAYYSLIHLAGSTVIAEPPISVGVEQDFFWLVISVGKVKVV